MALDRSKHATHLCVLETIFNNECCNFVQVLILLDMEKQLSPPWGGMAPLKKQLMEIEKASMDMGPVPTHRDK